MKYFKLRDQSKQFPVVIDIYEHSYNLTFI